MTKHEHIVFQTGTLPPEQQKVMDKHLARSFEQTAERIAQPPTLTPVQSSNVAAIGHDERGLWVSFHGSRNRPGSVYLYRTAGKDHHDALLATDSPGRYLLDKVKMFHHGERMG